MSTLEVPSSNPAVAARATSVSWLGRSGAYLGMAAACLLVAADVAHLIHGTAAYYGALSLVGLVLGAVSARLALGVLAFALPLLPTLPAQIAVAQGGPPFLPLAGGLNLTAGVVLGIVGVHLFRNRAWSRRFALPWPVACVIWLVTVSASLAIARNLWQSGQGFRVEDLAFFLLHPRGSSWQDDYFPLFGWLAYGVTTALIAVAIQLLTDMRERDRLIFRPVMAGLAAAALFGLGQWTTGFGYLRDGVGQGVNGLQPDIHAYAGHMLLGVAGLWGYLAIARSRTEQLLGAAVVALSWMGLVASGSRASIVFGAAITLGLVIALALRRSWRWAIGLGAVLVVILIALWPRLTEVQVRGVKPVSVLQELKSLDAAKANEALSQRPHLAMTAVHMTAQLPVLGVGQGNFGRMGVDREFSGSEVLAALEGENAHNYFAQTLAELGLAGALALTLALLAPVLWTTPRHVLIPGYVAVLGVFLGNVAAHSLLIRENLLLNGLFIALLYSWAAASPQRHGVGAQAGYGMRAVPRAGVIAAVAVLIAGGVEVARSVTRPPFEFASACLHARPLGTNGWMYGEFRQLIPPGAKAMRLQFERDPASADFGQQTARVEVRDASGRVLLQEERLLTAPGAFEFLLKLPEGAAAGPSAPMLRLWIEPCRAVPRSGSAGAGHGIGLRVLTAAPA